MDVVSLDHHGEERGSRWLLRGKVQDFPVKPMEIVDVTGAGDTVISTLALAVANSLSIEDAISLGQFGRVACGSTLWRRVSYSR